MSAYPRTQLRKPELLIRKCILRPVPFRKDGFLWATSAMPPRREIRLGDDKLPKKTCSRWCTPADANLRQPLRRPLWRDRTNALSGEMDTTPRCYARGSLERIAPAATTELNCDRSPRSVFQDVMDGQCPFELFPVHE